MVEHAREVAAEIAGARFASSVRAPCRLTFGPAAGDAGGASWIGAELLPALVRSEHHSLATK